MGFLAPIAPYIAGGGVIAQAVSDSSTASYNAGVAEDQADAIRQAEAMNAATRETEFRKVQASNIARAASRGLKLKGAPMQILIDNAYNFERDQATARYNAEVQARQYENRGTLLKNQSRSLITGGLIDGLGTTGMGLLRQKELKIPKG